MEFSYLSGRLSLDFAGTLMWRGSDREQELLRSPADLDEWVTTAGVLDSTPTVTGREFERAIAMREAIHQLITSRGGTAAQATNHVLAATTGPLPHMSLDEGHRVHRSGTIDTALTVLARDAIELVGGADADKIRQCAGEHCTRLFIDSSRGKPRRWCGMNLCGNRAKAASYRRRKDAENQPSAS